MSYEGRLVAVVETKGAKTSAAELDKFADTAKRTESATKKMSAGIVAGGKAFAGLATVAATVGAAMVGMAAKIAQHEDELADLAKVAGMTTDKFKELSFAYGAFGVSAQDVAEKSRLVLKELGQFQTTGAGGFADILEILKGKSDLTAESLRGLSGSDVLQKLKNEFDAANIPIEQQQYLFDSVARGAGALLPILENGGEAVAELSDKYRKYNDELKITAEQSNKMGEVADDIDLLSTTISNAGNMLVATFLPELQSTINWMLENIPKATDVLSTMFDRFHDPAAMQKLDAVQVKIMENLEDQAELEKDIEKSRRDFEITRNQDYRFEEITLNKKLGLLKEELVALEERKKILSAPEPVEPKAAGTGVVVDIAAARKKREEDKKLNDDRAKEAADWAAEQEEFAMDELNLINELDAKRRESLANEKARYESMREQANDYVEQLKKLGMTQLELIDAQESERLQKLAEYANQGLIEYSDFEDAKTAILMAAAEERNSFELAQAQTTLAGAASLFGNLAELQKQFGSEQSGTYKALFAASKAFSIAQAGLAIVAAAQGLADPTAVTLGQKLANYAALTAAVGSGIKAVQGVDYSPRQQGGQVRAGQQYLVGEKGPELLQLGTSGRIAPNGQEQAEPPQVNVTVINQASGVKVDTDRQDDGHIIMIVRNVLESETMNPNSRFNSALSKTRNAPRKW